MCQGPSTSYWGMMVLSADLKSVKSSLAYEFLLSRCDKVRWSTIEMASAVEPWTLYKLQMV